MRKINLRKSKFLPNYQFCNFRIHFKTPAEVDEITNKNIDPFFQAKTQRKELVEEEMNRFKEIVSTLYIIPKRLSSFHQHQIDLKLHSIMNGLLKDKQIELTSGVKTGELVIKGLSANREANPFIHEFEYSRMDDVIQFSRIAPSEEPMEAVESLQSKEINEEVKVLEKGVKGFSLTTFFSEKLSPYKKYLGFREADGKKKDKLSSKILTKISPLLEDKLLVEDFTLKAFIQGEEGFLGIRTETELSAKNPPSFSIAKNRRVIDFNGMLKGNPQVKVKQFIN